MHLPTPLCCSWPRRTWQRGSGRGRRGRGARSARGMTVEDVDDPGGRWDGDWPRWKVTGGAARVEGETALAAAATGGLEVSAGERGGSQEASRPARTSGIGRTKGTYRDTKVRQGRAPSVPSRKGGVLRPADVCGHTRMVAARLTPALRPRAAGGFSRCRTHCPASRPRR
jgi:hypothetical protein